MLTVAICMLYYGIAVWIYQLIGWFSDGVWTPYPIRKTWEAIAGQPTVDSPDLGPTIDFLLDLPLGRTLVLIAIAIILARFASVILEEVSQRWERRRWVLDQCKRVGLYPWVVPEIMEELKKEQGASKGRFEKKIR